MNEVLIINDDIAMSARIKRAVSKHALSVRHALSPALAFDLLRNEVFCLVISNRHVELKEQSELSHLLWLGNPLANFVIFDDNLIGETEEESRLLGIDIAFGEDAWRTLNDIILKSTNKTQNEQGQMLVVEDLDAPRDIICSYVESLGCKDTIGTSGAKEAMRLLEEKPEKWSCVLTDIRMPEISGKTLIENIRNNQKLKHLPIIVITAWGSVDCLIDCLKVGASGFLIKPPKKKDFIRELSRARRIFTNRANPRLTTPEEADKLMDILLEKGYR